MPDVNIASGEGGGGKYVIFTGYWLYVPRVLARVVVVSDVLQTAWEIKSTKENLERSRKSRLDILQAASAGDCISDCNGLCYRCAHQVIGVH